MGTSNIELAVVRVFAIDSPLIFQLRVCLATKGMFRGGCCPPCDGEYHAGNVSPAGDEPAAPVYAAAEDLRAGHPPHTHMIIPRWNHQMVLTNQGFFFIVVTPHPDMFLIDLNRIPLKAYSVQVYKDLGTVLLSSAACGI